ncbi:MAG: hypothetical protein MUP98_00815 [Candidatus Aminicenantes bacterium]|nr:hypothetical protein [Candidatus Aminicenantes bacterium]
MENEKITRDYERKAIRNVARSISSVVAGFILLFAVGQWIGELSAGRLTQGWRLSTTGMAVYIILITLGSSLGWWRENIGGTILVIAGLGMLSAIFIFLPPHDYWFSLIFSLPFLLSGILYLIYWKRSKPSEGKKRIG